MAPLLRYQRGSIPSDQELLPGEHTYGSLADRITGVVSEGMAWRWLAGIGITLSLTMVLLSSISWVLLRGVGVWGIDIPVAWAFAITNFVWWIGIGHAGTLISAILLLLRQSWRNSINRFAEAMTLFAVANAAMFPLLHLGRFWKFYYLLPYPNQMNLWPQWRSPLVWDAFAVMTYGLVSLLFWYLGFIPDMATLRDSARRKWTRLVAGYACLGWRGSARHWQRYEMAYLLLAGLATPLVVSVHSIVSLDFAVAIVPGWHSTLFPPYFVAGAIFSGMAMVLTLAIPLRRVMGMQDLITVRHLDVMAKVMLASGLIVAYSYVMEAFTEWLSGEPAELARFANRAVFTFQISVLCNAIVPQALWFRWVRTRPLPLLLVSLLVNLGMWMERYDIIVTSLSQDYLPSAWGWYIPTIWDWTLLIGSLGFFTLLFLLFLRLIPSISINELQRQVHSRRNGKGAPPASAAGEAGEPPAALAGGGEVLLLRLTGLTASFDSPEAVTRAAERLRAAGYTRLDACTPFPVEPLPEALGLRRTRLPIAMVIGGILGGGGAYFMQWYSAVEIYPWNVGGRPVHSWPSFIPITFELTILGAALVGFFGVLIASGLPRPHHPLMDVPGFARATRDRFFIVVDADDPRFDPRRTTQDLADLGPLAVREVRA